MASDGSTRPVPRAIRRAQTQLGVHALAWRKLRGLTQEQLAERAGVNRKVVMRLESGEGGVAVDSLLRILRGLGILDSLTTALDPYETDLGRLRSAEQLPDRVRQPKAPDG